MNRFLIAALGFLAAEYLAFAVGLLVLMMVFAILAVICALVWIVDDKGIA